MRISWNLLGIALLPLALCSCGHIYTDSDTYAQAAGVEVNGAKVSAAVKPEGGGNGLSFSAMVYMAGGAKLKGPFSWRIEAEGVDGVHARMKVHRLKVATEKTGREEWFPEKYLAGYSVFKPVPKEEGVSFASFRLPGKLEVYPEKDGAFTVTADVTIETKSSSVRRLVKFPMARSREKDVDFIFLPAEIAKGWKPNPRDWRWKAL